MKIQQKSPRRSPRKSPQRPQRPQSPPIQKCATDEVLVPTRCRSTKKSPARKRLELETKEISAFLESSRLQTQTLNHQNKPNSKQKIIIQMLFDSLSLAPLFVSNTARDMIIARKIIPEVHKRFDLVTQQSVDLATSDDEKRILRILRENINVKRAVFAILAHRHVVLTDSKSDEVFGN